MWTKLLIITINMMDKTQVKGKIRIFEAFAGIGAQRKALDLNGQNFEVVGMAEWFIPAIVSYQAIHNRFSLEKIDHKISREEMIDYLSSKTLSMDSKEPVSKDFWKRKHLDFLRIVFTAVKMSEKEGNIFDVRTLFKRTLKGVDLLTYSFPCQDLSQQGNQKGMAKDSKTRSGLLWEIEKALDSTPKTELPKFLLMENVVALTHKTNEKELNAWIDKLEELGYENSIGVLNAAEFGASQARRRAFMISSLKGRIELPKGNEKPRAIRDILDSHPQMKNYLPALDKFDLTEFKLTNSNINKSKLIDYSSFNSEAFVYDLNYTGPTLTASGANSRIKIRENQKIRKLSASESFKYMGFELKDFEAVNNLNFLNDSQMIYTCGNSISVEVLRAIMKRFK